MNIADIRSVLKYSKWLNVHQRNNVENNNAVKLYIHHHQLIIKEKQMIRTRGITQEFHFPSASCLRGRLYTKILWLPEEQPHTSSAIFFFNSSSWIKFRHQTRHSPFVIAKRMRVTKEILFHHCSFPYSSEWRISFFLQKSSGWWLSFVSQL